MNFKNRNIKTLPPFYNELERMSTNQLIQHIVDSVDKLKEKQRLDKMREVLLK